MNGRMFWHSISIHREKLVAGSMLFYFGRRVLHTQYLVQDADYSHLFTMNFLDHEMIALAKKKRFSVLFFRHQRVGAG